MTQEQQQKIERICEWVRYHGKGCGYDGECPKVGYLGYANGMTETEWTVVCIACDIIKADGGDPREYFTYNVDSSD